MVHCEGACCLPTLSGPASSTNKKEGTLTTSKAGPTENLWSLIKDSRYPVLTTRKPNGGLRSRPMTLQNRDTDPVEADLAPGRPLHAATWVHLLEGRGFTGARVEERGSRHAIVASR